MVNGAPRPNAAPPRPPVVLRDAQSIKILTHPARLAVLDELFNGRQLTATEAAEIVGVSPSAMSYHLRALQKAGIVERIDSADGRERPWRAAGSRLEVHSDDSPLASAAGAVLASTVLERMSREFTSWMSHMQDEEKPWRDVAGMLGSVMWMDLDEAKALEKALEKLIDDVRGRAESERPPGARRMRLGVLFYPQEKGASE